MKNNAVISVEKVNLLIKDKKILSDINFEIRTGEIVGLVGPNGAGKTSLMKLMTSLSKISSGKIKVNGRNIVDNKEESLKCIGAMIENPSFYEYLSGWKNLIHYARMLNEEIQNEDILKIVERVNLTNAINNKVKTYSLGMKQRLGIAQALLHNPDLLILDEPMNGLDPKGVAELREFLKQLSENGTSVLVSSHLLGEIEKISTRVLYIEGGKLIKDEITDSSSPLGKKIYLKVDSIENALNIIRDMFNDVIVRDGLISVDLKNEDMSTLIKPLVDNNIWIYDIIRYKDSLEEKYLELMN